MKGIGILLALATPLLPIFLIAQNHQPYFSSTLLSFFSTIGLAPWERLILPKVDPYHQQFIALALLISVATSFAAIYKVLFSSESIARNLAAYRVVYGAQRSVIPAYDDDRLEVFRSWLFGSLLSYLVRLLSIYLMSFDVTGGFVKNKNIVILISPEITIITTVISVLGATMAVCRLKIEFPIDRND